MTLNNVRESIIRRLYCLGRSFKQAHNHRSSLHDLTVRQIQALHAIAQQPEGATITQLAAEGQVTAATASQLADRLTGAGWTERVPDKTDKRQTRIKLTETGRQHFQQAATCRLQHLHETLKKFDSTDLAELDRLLGKFESIYMTTNSSSPNE